MGLPATPIDAPEDLSRLVDHERPRCDTDRDLPPMCGRGPAARWSYTGPDWAARPARQGRSQMGVIIVREMVGTSAHSWSDAARQAVALASKTVRNIRTVEVVQSTARVEGGEIVEYRVQLKLGFEYEE